MTAKLGDAIPVEVSEAKSDEELIWNTLNSFIGNPYGTAGLMGNLYAESALKANNLQNSFNKKLNITDEDYTQVVDANAYLNFVTDKAGYGLAQWTYYSRKQNRLNYARNSGKSIGDFQMQLDFLCEELKGYKAVLSTLRSATSVRESSDIVLTQFERPADQSEAVKAKRAGYGQTYFDKFAGKASGSVSPIVPQASTSASSECPYIVKVDINDLNIRKGPGTNYAKLGKYTGQGIFTIVKESDGNGASKWGLLKSYQNNSNGWISLDYATKIKG